MILGFLLSRSGIATIAAAIAGVAIAFAAGHYTGKKSARVVQLQATVKAHETRNEVDAVVEAMDAVGMCVRLGGKLPECQRDAVRRLEEDSASR